MSSKRQLVFATLKELTRKSIRLNVHLHMVRQSRKALQEEEEATERDLKDVRQRVERELAANAQMLGVERVDGEDDNEGEGWKDRA